MLNFPLPCRYIFRVYNALMRARVDNVLTEEQLAAAVHDLANSGFVLVDHAEDALQILARLTNVTDQDFTVRFHNPHGAKITVTGGRNLADIIDPQR